MSGSACIGRPANDMGKGRTVVGLVEVLAIMVGLGQEGSRKAEAEAVAEEVKLLGVMMLVLLLLLPLLLVLLPLVVQVELN